MITNTLKSNTRQNIYNVLYSPVANSLGRSKSPTTNPMTAMLAVNKFKSAGINQIGQRHKNGSSGRRTAENKLIPPQHPSTGQNDACSLLLLFLFR